MAVRPEPSIRGVSIVPDLVDKVLSAGAAVLLVAVLAAIVHGQPRWSQATPLIWAHLGTIVASLALTPVLLLRRRGDRVHRQLGWFWVTSMMATAALSFGIRTINPGGFSLIHALSAFTLVMAPLIAWYARKHRIHAHRMAVRGMVMGALLIAGFFTFPFQRMLGRWLFG